MSATCRRPPRRAHALLWHQIRYEQLSFWRNPQSAFFTFVFPVVVIAVFGAMFGGGRTGSSNGCGPRRCRPGRTSSACWRTASC